MMKLETDTPLSDVIKYIKDATQNEAAGLPSGIQFTSIRSGSRTPTNR